MQETKRHRFPGVYTDQVTPSFSVRPRLERLPIKPNPPAAPHRLFSGTITRASDDALLGGINVHLASTRDSLDVLSNSLGVWNAAVHYGPGYTAQATGLDSGGTATPYAYIIPAGSDDANNLDFVYNGTGGFGPQPYRLIGGSLYVGDEPGCGFDGQPITNHPITLTQAGPVSSATDGAGNYSFVASYNGGTLVPAPISTGTFAPALIVVPAGQPSSINNDFVYNGTGSFGPQPLPTTLRIFGHVADEFGMPIYETFIDINGTGSQYTDEDGYYQVEVPYGFTGTVAAIDLFGSMSPTSYEFYGLGTHAGGRDFQFSVVMPPLVMYTIGGTIWDNYMDAPWSGQTVNVDGFDPITTDDQGRYQFTVPGFYQGNITPMIVGEGSLSPAFSFYIDTPSSWIPAYGADLSYNFQYWFNPGPTYYAISGKVMDGHTGAPLNNVLVDISDISPTTTDIDGNWGMSALSGYTGRATPIDVTGTFDPVDRGYENLGTDATFQDFYFYQAGCPTPTGDVDITTTGLLSIARNVSANGKLYVIDFGGPTVVVIDELTATQIGTVSTSPGGDWGLAGIAYDPYSGMVVVQDYQNNVQTIDPMTDTVVGVAAASPEAGFHTLAIGDNGTAYTMSYRNTMIGRVDAIDLNTMTNVAQFALPYSADSIAWAPNIQKCVLLTGGFGSPRFRLLDPATETWEDSTLTNATTFSYECFYVAPTGHMLMSRDSNTVQVVDISMGAAATVVTTLTGQEYPTRVSDACINVCNNRLFVSDGNYAIYEYDLTDNRYLLMRVWNGDSWGISPTGLSHSRVTNLVYWGDWNDQHIRNVRSVGTAGTNVENISWYPDVSLTGPLATGSGSINAGDGVYNAESYGDDVNSMQMYDVTWYGGLTHNGSPYLIEVTFNYSGTQASVGNMDVSNTQGMSADLNGDYTDYFNWTPNISISGSFTAIGTVYEGWNWFEIDIQNYTGATFSGPPAFYYSKLDVNFTVRPLTAP